MASSCFVHPLTVYVGRLKAERRYCCSATLKKKQNMKFVYNKTIKKFELISISKFNSDIENYQVVDNLYGVMNFAVKYCDYRQISCLVSQIMRSQELSQLKKRETEFVLKYSTAIPVEKIIAYFMTSGMTIEQAQGEFLKIRAKAIRNLADCYKERIASVEFTELMISQLGQEQAEQFLVDARIPIQDLERSAVLGTAYENSTSGIMDFIDGTGSYIDGGLSNYTVADLELLKKRMKDILYHGYES